MAPPAAVDTRGKTPVPHNKRHLGLVSAAKPQRLTPALLVHFLFVFLPHVFVTLPITIAWQHLIARWRSPIVQYVGRPVYADFVVKLSQFILSRCTAAQARMLFNRDKSYNTAYSAPPFRGYRDWVTYVDVNGTTGRWIAPPHTDRSKDEVVLYYVHGGGFVLDTAGSAQLFFLALAKDLNLKRKVQFSVFALDYELAPEFKYPSQLIETLAGYRYLVNEVGISEEKICLSGDSAGGNLATTFLLHLARPNPAIKVPKELGPTPKRPGSAILISPFVNLVSHTRSRKKNAQFDFIEDGGAYLVGLDYIGVEPTKRAVPSFNPYHFFAFPNPPPPRSLRPGRASFVAGQAEGTGLALFDSPYVNPCVQKDPEWWKDACPGDGRTMVTWGGVEIFADDIKEFTETLESAGVAPVRLYKELGAHDWVLSDTFVPGAYKTNSTGPDREQRYAVDQFADFLQQTDIRVRQAQRVESAKVGKANEVKEAESKGARQEKTVTGGARQRKVAKDEKEAKSELEESAVLMEKAQ